MANVGHARARRGTNEEALQAFQLANQIWHDLRQKSSNPSYRVMEASTLSILAARQQRLHQDFRGALAMSQKARRLLTEAVQAEPGRTDWQFLLAKTLREEAFFTQRSGARSASLPLYEESIGLYQELLKSEPSDSPHRLPNGDTCREYADLLVDIQQQEKSLEFYRMCVESWNSLCEVDALTNNDRGRLATVYARIGDVSADLGRSYEAIAAFRRSIEVASESRKRPNAPRKAITALIHSNSKLGELLRKESQFDAAISCLQQAIELLSQEIKARPSNLNFKQQLESARMELELSKKSATQGVR
jgi:tetratricopeptide (TPR) repeat protein